MGDIHEANPVAASINNVAIDINGWAKDKGFWESWDDAEWLDQFDEGVTDEALERFGEIAGRIRTLVLASKLMLVSSELGEALETLRDTGADDLDPNFREELADAVIRLFDLSGQVNSPVGDEIMKKMKVNETRPHKHGRVI